MWRNQSSTNLIARIHNAKGSFQSTGGREGSSKASHSCESVSTLERYAYCYNSGMNSIEPNTCFWIAYRSTQLKGISI